MYAVIKTGGKQYRVQPGDLLVVEKLEGEPGAEVVFDQVLMLGDDVGAPLVKGATVSATLIETRKGEKIKIFKKIRRQGYRRTRGHRQLESVLQVTAIDGGKGKMEKWDGTVDLTTKAERDLRARNLARLAEAAEAKTARKAETKKAAAAATPKAPARKAAPKKAEAAPQPEATEAKAAPKKAEAPEKKAKEAAPKKAAAPKAEATTETKAAPKKAPAKKDKEA